MTNFDELLSHVGDFGWYQKRISILGCLPLVPFAFVLVGVVFLGNSPQHWCRIDNAEKIQDKCGWSELELRARIAPRGSRCHRFNVDWTAASEANCSSTESEASLSYSPLDSTLGLEPCDNGWVFNSSHITVVTEVILYIIVRVLLRSCA